MTTIKLDHVYVSVENMDRAIAFYQDLLGMKVVHREANQWADFDLGDGCYFGLIDFKILGDKRIIGNNAIPTFWADEVDAVYEKIKKHKVKVFFPPMDLPNTSYRYYCFACEDTEGNAIEITNYERKR